MVAWDISKVEWVALGLTSLTSGTLSMIASGLIIWILLRNGREKLSKMHHRISFSSSIVDVLNSCALILPSILLPREVSPFVGGFAYGNNHSCSAQGFLITMGFGVPIYDACLCVYYLAVVKYGVRDETLLAIEKYIHGAAVLVPMSIASIGLVLELYHPTDVGICWFSNGCDIDTTSECVPESQVLRDSFSYTILAICVLMFLLIVYAMGSLYLFVREQTISMHKYQVFERRNSIVGHEDKKGAHEETLVQALLYVIAFICTYTFPLICHFMKGSTPFTVMVLRSLFYPAHGIWSLLIYLRPRYVLLQEKERDISFWGAFKVIAFGVNEDNSEGKNQRMTARLSIIRQSRNSNRNAHDLIDCNDPIASKEETTPQALSPLAVLKSQVSKEASTLEKKCQTDESSTCLHQAPSWTDFKDEEVGKERTSDSTTPPVFMLYAGDRDEENQ